MSNIDLGAKEAAPLASVHTVLAVLATIFVAGCGVHYLGGFYFWGKSGFAVGNDDAFISFRYSVNLINHGILSFNPSDQPRVEGYSNPLHVAITSLVYLVTQSKDLLYPTIAALSVLAVVFALALAVSTTAKNAGMFPAIAVGAAIALNPSFWVHTTSGLETAFVFLAQCVIWVSMSRVTGPDVVARDRQILLAASVLIVTLRTDGFVFPLIAAGWLFVAGRPRLGFQVAIAAMATFIILMLVRYGYYGEWMPNTYYAKLNGALFERLIYAARIFASISLKNGLLIYVGFAAIAAMAWLIDTFRKRKFVTPDFELIALLAMLTYYFLIGADIYRERFLLIAYPLGAAVMAKVLLDSVKRVPLRAAGVAGAVALQLGALWMDPKFEYNFARPKYDPWIYLGKHLASHHHGQVLATGAAGKIPFFSGLHTVDVLGLNDHHIARTIARGTIPGHGRFDIDYVFRKKPDLIADHVYGDGHMIWGFTREVYQSQGYRLTYLIRSDNKVDPPMIELPPDTPDLRIKTLIDAGYSFGVLARMAK